jgi:hypothetical protein
LLGGVSEAELTVILEFLQRARDAVAAAGRAGRRQDVSDRATRGLAAICGIAGVVMTQQLLEPTA